MKGERNGDRLTKYITDVTLAISIARSGDVGGGSRGWRRIAHNHIIPILRQLLQPDTARSATDLSDLRLACANADPNYGSLWFFCRRGSSDPPTKVIEQAAERVAEDVHQYAHAYLAALLRRKAVLSMIGLEKPSTLVGKIETSDPNAIKWEDLVENELLAYPTLQEIFNPVDPTTGLVLLDSKIDGSLFIAGLADGRSLLECGHLGTASASLVASGLGSDAGVVDRDQTEAAMAAWRSA